MNAKFPHQSGSLPSQPESTPAADGPASAPRPSPKAVARPTPTRPPAGPAASAVGRAATGPQHPGTVPAAAVVTAVGNDSIDDPASPQRTRNVQVHLRKIPLFAGLNDEEMLSVKNEMRIRHYPKRAVVLHKGGSGDGLLFLLSGQLQVVDVTEDGRAIGLRMLQPGDFFGEIALINSTTRSASVVSTSEVLVGFLPAQFALHLFTHSPSVAQQMLSHLAQKIQRDSEFRSLLSINNTVKRIYSFLRLMQQPPTGDQPDALPVVENLPTHQDIANMINTSRETVTRALAALVQKGVVQKDAHRLIIIKPEVLKQLVQGDGKA